MQDDWRRRSVGDPAKAPKIPKIGAKTVQAGGRMRNVTPIVFRLVNGLTMWTQTMIVNWRSRVTRIA